MPVSSSAAKGLDFAVFIPDPDAPFKPCFNRQHFRFRHQLGKHPAFAVPRLVELADWMLKKGKPDRFVAFRATRRSAETKFSQLAMEASLTERIRQISAGETWLKLAFAQEADATYRTIHDNIIDEAEALSGYPLRREIGWSSMTIMVASPGIVTPYHIDHESNFLFQIEGEKDIWLFDGSDRRVLGEQEIERYYAGDAHAADYREDLQAAGALHGLAPGVGIHNPSLAPHWVRNGNNVSVSVSLNFSLPILEYRARVYQANHYIRRLGLRPIPPGRSPVRDRLKNGVARALTRSRPASLEELLRSGLPRLARARFGKAASRQPSSRRKLPA